MSISYRGPRHIRWKTACAASPRNRGPRVAGEGDSARRYSSETSEQVDSILACLSRAVSLAGTPQKVVVMGCGPFPATVGRLSNLDWDCSGEERATESPSTAREYLGRPAAILAGSAEDLPLGSGSKSLLIMESVL